ncbi:type IX secretion system membrane protein PorP/SprF [uncultured Algibacter sp.]|uniref:PorP/SprF family type IX secretion system membrane protein n=1 Tax=uncultured Algibacter sp. TaxID=298659 RepID=UPI003216CED7
MRKIITYICIMAITYGYSQELNLPVFTQYLADNNFVVSPTYAGIGDNLRIRANGLTQWVGIDNAPDNQSLYADVRIADRSGIGLSLYNDKNGNTLQKGAKISFAHHLILDYYSKQYLSFGISYNLNSFRIDIEKFRNFNGNTGSPSPVDPFVTDDRATNNNNFDAGFLYRFKGYFLSFNANNILEKQIDEALRRFEPNLLLNYQVYSGYTFQGRKGTGIEWEPSVYYQLFSSDSRSSTDINLKFRKFNRREDYYWAGISYRFLNDQLLKPLNVGPMAGLKKGQFYFGYAYQVTTNELAGFNSGTHVITVGFDFLKNLSNCPCTQSPVHY